jgi:hypothetical protein
MKQSGILLISVLIGCMIPAWCSNTYQQETSMYNQTQYLIHQLNTAYQQRDTTSIDQLFAESFSQLPPPVIIGTSLGEICLNTQQSKELIRNDFLYWGQVALQTDNAQIFATEDGSWFHVSGTVTMEFSNDAQTNAHFFNIIDSITHDTSLSNERRLTTINWLLAHYLSYRPSGTRKDAFPLHLSGCCRQIKGKAVFRYLHFSIPSTATTWYVRLEEAPYNADYLHKEIQGLSSVSQAPIAPELAQNINTLLHDPTSSLLADTCITLTAGLDQFNTAEAAIHYLHQQFGHADSIEININSSFSIALPHMQMVTATGVMNFTQTSEQSYNKLQQIIETHLQDTTHSTHTLFNIRKDIANTLRENSVGSSYSLPFRIETLWNADLHQFQALSITAPFDCVLEGIAH